MHYISLFIELLRARPRLLFWIAALAQGALWTIVPALFYAAPPGDLPTVIAVGHEFQLWNYLGPPLAFWLAEVAFRIGGMFAVYLLSQACVVAAYWALFTLGCAIVGARHAIIAVLLMVGVSAFTVPTAEFGPAVLALPLWSLALLHAWRAVGENRPQYWLALGADLGLLLLTTTAGLLFLVLILFYMVVSRPARAAFDTIYPWIAGLIVIVLLFPHIIWFDQTHGAGLPALQLASGDARTDALNFLWIVGSLIAAHAGLGVLAALASNLPGFKREPAPVIRRAPVGASQATFVWVFALVPAAIATLVAVALGVSEPVGGAAPLLIFSGLFVVLIAGDAIVLHHQRILGYAWFAMLAVPPLLIVIGLLTLPWIFNSDLRVSQPAVAMGRFFTDSFQRRTGKPLSIVAGNQRLASLIALTSRARPHLYVDAHPERSPWIAKGDIGASGAVVVWPATDFPGTPPAEIKARFPQIVPELPQAFAHPLQDQRSPLRVGWAMIRPKTNGPSVSPPR